MHIPFKSLIYKTKKCPYILRQQVIREKKLNNNVAKLQFNVLVWTHLSGQLYLCNHKLAKCYVVLL
jgi:hypothetical protein